MYLTKRYQKNIYLVKYLIPKVSRTFALNIKVLSYEDEIIIAVAYLICRYLDTIEDSAILTSRKKIKIFNQVEKIFLEIKNKPKNRHWESWQKEFFSLAQKDKTISTNEAENKLWRDFPLILELYLAFPPKVQSILLSSILTMAEGMKNFILKNQTKKNKVILDEKEMQEYCYYVAGTVGQMLTKFFSLKIKDKKIKKNLQQREVAFGLGLQMINILKDFFKDRKRGWVYLPKKSLAENGLTLNEFFSFKIEKKNQILKVYLDLIKKADYNLEKSVAYITEIPKKLIRYRLFCLIPLMLAIKTSSLLKKQQDFSNFKKKISKKEVFFILFFSRIAVLSNNLIKKYFYFYK